MGVDRAEASFTADLLTPFSRKMQGLIDVFYTRRAPASFPRSGERVNFPANLWQVFVASLRMIRAKDAKGPKHTDYQEPCILLVNIHLGPSHQKLMKPYSH